MKELDRNNNLTNLPQTPYSRGGDISMPEPGQGEVPPQGHREDISMDEANRRIEEAARKGEDARMATAGGTGTGGRGKNGEPPEKPPAPQNPESSDVNGSERSSGEPANADVRRDEENERETGGEVSSTESLKQELEGVSEQADFPEIQQFLRAASGISITTREQLEDIHRGFGNASNEVLSRIQGEFGEKDKALFEEFAAKRPATDKERKDLAEEFETKREALRKEFRSAADRLRGVRSQFLDVLGKRFGSGRRDLTPAQQTMINAINLLESASKSAATEEHRNELRRELREIVVNLSDTVAPQDESLPDDMLIAIGKDNFATEKFLDKVIRLKGEDFPYHLPGMYSDINVNKFLRLNESLMETDKMEHIQNLLRGTETLHEMNRILKTSVDQFAQISQTILPEHLTTIFQLPGVQDIFQLYEGIIKENIAIETMIMDDVFKRIDEQVEKEFKAVVKKQMFDKNYLTKSYGGEGEMKDWEIERAVSYGKNLIRTLLREAEYVSFSHIPEAQRAFISLAQGQLLGVLNPIMYTLKRFKPGESHGGVELLEEVLKKAVEKRRHGRNKEASRGIVRLKELQGTSVEDREATKATNARGNIATWRSTEAILAEFTIVDNGRASTITQFFKEHEKEISMLKEISSSNAWGTEFERTKGKINGETYNDLKSWQNARILQVFGPLLGNSAAGQGILVSSIPLAIPTEVREILWEKISELNPDVMASLLTRLEIDGEAEGAEDLSGVRSLEEILLERFGTDEQKRLLLELKIPDKSLRGMSFEEIGDLTMIAIRSREDIKKRLEAEVDPGKRKVMEQDLEELESSIQWRPRLLKQELGRLGSEEILRREIQLQDAKSQSDKDKLRAELAEKAPDYDRTKRELENLDREVKKLLRDERWVILRKKLRTINRLRMRDEKERMDRIRAFELGSTITDVIVSPKSFASYMKDERLVEEDRLTDNEIDVVNGISQNGRKISKDLANIRQASIWFLDDVPTDNIRWENLGQSFNRMIGDFGQFAQAANELNEFLYDPFKMSAEKVREHLSKAIRAAGQVLGVEAVQDQLNTLFEIVPTYNEWTRTYRRFDWIITNMIWSAGEKYTSKAQELSRDISALSLDADGMHEQLLEQNHASIIRKEKRDSKTGKIMYEDLYKKQEKALRAGPARRFLWENIKNYGPFFLLGMIISLFKGTTAKRQ